MKVLLIIPINRSYVVTPSLGLGYIASVLRNKGHDVKILHCIKEKMTFDGFAEFLEANKFDVIGIQMFTYDLAPAIKHLKIIKQKLPNAITVVGGYHPSGAPRDVLHEVADADYGFISEVEIGFPIFLEEVVKEKPDMSVVPNLIYRKGEVCIVNEIKLIDDLDIIPFPAWDLMDPREYPDAPHGGFAKSFPTAPIMITRGCPLKCTFCAGRSITFEVRKRSIKNVIEEIEYLKENFDVIDFLIEDENFTLHRKLVKEFCETIIEKKLGITWSCPSGIRLDTINPEMLKMMEASGCYSVAVGVEFGSDRIHQITKKKLTIEKIERKMSLFKDVNIKTTGFFLFGVPGETKDEMLETIQFSKKLPLDRAQFNNFMPLPGTEIFDDLKKKGIAFDYDNYFVHDVAYVPEGMTLKDMKKLQRSAYLGFYFRPKIIMAILAEIATLKQFYRLILRFFDSLR
jgi:radical SAM superfamily enzyme YgiQ (UPF0313 family)